MSAAGRGVVLRRGSPTHSPASPQQGKLAFFARCCSSILISFTRAKIAELHAQLPTHPSSQHQSSPPAETAAPAPAPNASDDDYDPDIQDSPCSDPSPALPPPPPPPRIRVADTAAAAAAAMAALEEHDLFAVDLEGVELGRGGTIAILQVRARVDGVLDMLMLFCTGCSAGCRWRVRRVHFRYFAAGS